MSVDTDPTGSNGDQWLSSLLEDARTKHPFPPDRLFDELDKLLRGQLSERNLTPSSLKTVAGRLIGATSPNPSHPEDEE